MIIIQSIDDEVEEESRSRFTKRERDSIWAWPQCDQMARLFAQYLLTFDTENLPKSMTNLPK